jgi:hypothetical protein
MGRARGCALLGLAALLCASGPTVPAPGRAGAPAGGAGIADPAARLPGGDAGWEYWDLLARFEGGFVLAARFLVTNAGPGDQNGIAIGRVIRPDGSVVAFDNGRRRQRWTLSDDRLRLDIGSSHLDLAGHRLWFDKGAVKIDVRFTPGGWATPPADLTPDGYRLDVLDAAASVEGSLWLRGMEEARRVRGWIAITHTWSREPEADATRRRIEFYSLQGDAAVFGVDLTMPGGDRTRWWSARRRDGSIIATSDFELGLEGVLADRENARYWVPATLAARGPGVRGEVSLARTLAESDPLAPLPAPIRLLMSLTMKPRRVWAESTHRFELQGATGSEPFEGSGLVVTSFLAPLAN